MAESLHRLNTFIGEETFRNLRIVAAECGLKLHEATDKLIGLGIERYLEGKDVQPSQPD